MCNQKRLRASEEEQGIDRFTSDTLMKGTSLSVQVQTMMWMSFGASTKMSCSMAKSGQYLVNLTTCFIFITFNIYYSESGNQMVSFRESPNIWIGICHRKFCKGYLDYKMQILPLSYRASYYINTIRSLVKLHNTKTSYNLFNSHLDTWIDTSNVHGQNPDPPDAFPS